MSNSEIPVVRPPSEFSQATAEEFEATVAPHLTGAAAGLVIDLSGVSMITSAGLSVLVHTGKRLDERGAHMALAGGPRSVVKLFQLVGLEAVLPHFPSAEQATAWVRQKAP